MIGAARRFSELMSDLLLKRELAGGPLPQDDESAAAAELERCWWEMTDEEQAEAERIFSAEHRLGAPREIELQDAEVDVGARTLPRRAA